MAQDHAATMKSMITDFYVSETAKLPEVCDGVAGEPSTGRVCRSEIKGELEGDMSVRWSEATSQIRMHLETLITNSHSKMRVAYEAAYNCAHGCGCKFIEEQYTEIKNEIDERQAEIDELEGDILGLKAEIEGINDTICDFSDLIGEYTLKWQDMEDTHVEEMEALADWETDDWDMDQVVNQEAFEEAYGFKYEVERFDLY